MSTSKKPIYRSIDSRFASFLVIGVLMAMMLKLAFGVSFDHGDYRPQAGTVQYLKGDLPIEDVVHQTGFTPLDDTPSFGYGAAIYWLKIDLEVLDPNQKYFLKIAFPILNRVTLFQQQPSQRQSDGWQTYESGIDIMHATWSIPDRNIILPLQSGSQEVYVRLQTEHTLLAPLEIIPEDAFRQHEKTAAQIWGAFYGLVFIMTIYNALLFFSTRDSSYLYYVGYVVSTTLFVTSLNGYGYAYIWPEFPDFNANSGTIFPCLMMLFSIQFAQLFLTLGTHYPRIHRALNGLKLFNLILLVSAIVISTDLNMVTSLLVNVSVLAMLASGLYCLYQGHRSAGYFVVGWTAFLVGVGIYALTTLGFLPVNGFTLHSKEYGFVIEIMLLSFALADRIKSLTKESIRANTEKQIALKVANRALEESIQAKDEFLATISHELRTPLNGTMGALEVLKETHLDAQQSVALELALDTSQTLQGLVESILEFSELQTHTLRLKNRDFALKSSLLEIAEIYREQAEAKGLKLQIQFTGQVPEYALGDGQRFLQIIAQLLDNAVKFTQQGEVQVNVSTTGGQSSTDAFVARIAVLDTGAGIPEDVRDKIFQPFVQVDGSNTRAFGGLGLGLSLSRALAEKMNGELTYEPLEEGGSVFCISLPLKFAETGELIKTQRKLAPVENLVAHPAMAKAAANKQTPDPQTLNPQTLNPQTPAPKTILIVEDNHANMMIANAFCQKLGFKILQAQNGSLALDLVKQQHIDAILMDCQMPVMDGFQATKEIRALEGETSKIPIIAVTANTSNKDYNRCMEVGMNDFLKKPITKALIAEKLDHWLNLPDQSVEVNGPPS